MPTVFASRCDDPKMGGTPNCASGNEKTVSAAAILMSAASASPRPGARGLPFDRGDHRDGQVLDVFQQVIAHFGKMACLVLGHF